MYNFKLFGFDDSFVLVFCGYIVDIGFREVFIEFEILFLASFMVFICIILNINN